MKASISKKKNSQKKSKRLSESSEDEAEDISVVGNTLNVGVRGVRELIKAISEGTEEFQDLLCNECSLIYECRVCRNLFRSVANFISHKRKFCKRSFSIFEDDFSNSRMFSCINSQLSSTVNGDQETASPLEPTKSVIKKGMESLKRAREKLSNPNFSPIKKSRGSMSDSLTNEKINLCRLESFPQTRQAILQIVNSNDSLQTQLLEEEERMKEKEPTLLPDGSIATNGKEHKCSSCESAFSSEVALKKHTTVYHQKRICFPCPLCKIYMATAWGVFRHLNKIHRKTEEQIRKYRSVVLSKATERELYQPPKPSSDPPAVPVFSATARSEEEKWIAQFDGELHCTVCSKSFTRRAALTVHSATCKPKVAKPPPAPAPEPAPPPPPPEPVGPIKCEKCGKEFARKAVLTAHVQTCSGRIEPLRANICRFCGRVFPRRRPLLIHQTKCPRAPPCSPSRHLMTPPKLIHIPSQVSPSAIQVRRDYNKLSPMSQLRPMLPERLPLTKLESVVRKLHEKPHSPPSAPPLINLPPPPRIRKCPLGSEPKNGLRLSSPSLNIVTTPLTVQTNSIEETSSIKNIDSNTKVPNDTESLITIESSCILSTLVKVTSPKIENVEEVGNSQIVKETSQLLSRSKIDVNEEKETSSDLKINFNADIDEESTSPHTIEVIILEDDGSSNDQDNMEDKWCLDNKNTTIAELSEKECVEEAVLLETPTAMIEANSQPAPSCIKKGKEEIIFVEPNSIINQPTSPNLVNTDILSDLELHRDSISSSPVQCTEETRQETDSDLMSLASRGTDRSEDSNSGSGRSEVAHPLADDSGVSDDGSLREPQERTKKKSFKGFDAPLVADNESKKLLKEAIVGLEMELDCWRKNDVLLGANGVRKSLSPRTEAP